MKEEKGFLRNWLIEDFLLTEEKRKKRGKNGKDIIRDISTYISTIIRP